MGVRDVLVAAREAAVELRRIDEQAELRREQIGVQGHSYGIHSKNGILDPSRKIDDLLDWEMAQREHPELTGPLDEAWEVMAGIQRICDEPTFRIARRYWLEGETWHEMVKGTADEPPLSERIPSLSGLRPTRQVMVVSRSMDAVVSQWEAIGVARLREMGR